MVEPLICNKTNELNYLMALYNSTNGHQWHNHTHWMNTSVDYCKWHGVYCCNIGYPSHKTCINMIILQENNLRGSLPSFKIYLQYSSVLTIFNLEHNYINGTIPEMYDVIPNLSYLQIAFGRLDSASSPRNSLLGPIPQWPKSNCLAWYDIHSNYYLNSTIPQWNSQKYIVGFLAADTNLHGTIPNWDQWIWPSEVILAQTYPTSFHRGFHGTLPQFSSAKCPFLGQLELHNNALTGTVPALPPQVYTGIIKLYNNSFSGRFPWHSLDYASDIQLQDNNFEGNISPFNLKYIRGINITNNHLSGTLPCFYHNKQMIVIDARYNEFSSFSDNCKGWPKSIQIVLLSNNKINFEFDTFTCGLSNLSVIDFGNNQFKGTVPGHIIEGTATSIYVSFYDNDFSCSFPESTRKFNASWIYLGNDMSDASFVSYTNKYEKGLGIVAIVPKYELYEYLAVPMTICLITFIIYIYLFLGKFKNVQFQIRLNHTEFIQLREKDKLLYIMQTSVQFLLLLFIVAIIMMIIYVYGANHISCGYTSLQITVTYLGTQTNLGYDIYSWISLSLYSIYSMICSAMTAKLIRLSNSFIKTIPENIPSIQNNALIKSEIPFDEQSQQNKCIWFVKLLTIILTFFAVLFMPVIIYNAYHTIPSGHTIIPTINNNSSVQFCILYIIPMILAVGKFFGVPFTINKILQMLEQVGMNKKYRKNSFRNHLIQFIRVFNLIIIPIIILTLFDDKCFKVWKEFWSYCKQNNATCTKLAHSTVKVFNDELTDAWVCHDICSRAPIIPYRCLRRFFEVLGPLYVYKMNIAMCFPLLYYIKRRKWFNYYKNKIFCCRKTNKHISNNAGEQIELLEMDMEYMSLISSLEIVIVFGWAIPLLIPLYLVTIFGYWCVFGHGLHEYDMIVNKIIPQTKSLRPVTKWLLLSVITQNILAFLFYYATQSVLHGYLCLVASVLNFIVFIYYSIKK
eukprot:52527_1